MADVIRRLSFALAGLMLVGAALFKMGGSEEPTKETKINGVSFVAPARPVKPNVMQPIKRINAGWVAITPYAFSEAGKPGVSFNYDRQWWGERKDGVMKTIRYAKKLGLKVMLKPHVWVHGQGWTGDFDLQTDQQWKRWQHDYTNYILTFAKIADAAGVDLICIGTEYKKAAVEHPDFWRKLIKKVRAVYGGKLTYAANWDNYQNITFWDALDYIGIDAYFPISDQKTPSVDALREQWKPLKNNIQHYSKQQDKPILFTEFGYKSVDYAADGHWKYDRGNRAANNQAQVHAYRALFETFWTEDWFAGGFVWKWYHSLQGRYHHHRKKGYTPQGKPAAQILKQWYGSHH